MIEGAHVPVADALTALGRASEEPGTWRRDGTATACSPLATVRTAPCSVCIASGTSDDGRTHGR